MLPHMTNYTESDKNSAREGVDFVCFELILFFHLSIFCHTI